MYIFSPFCLCLCVSRQAEGWAKCFLSICFSLSLYLSPPVCLSLSYQGRAGEGWAKSLSISSYLCICLPMSACPFLTRAGLAKGWAKSLSISSYLCICLPMSACPFLTRTGLAKGWAKSLSISSYLCIYIPLSVSLLPGLAEGWTKFSLYLSLVISVSVSLCLSVLFLPGLAEGWAKCSLSFSLSLLSGLMEGCAALSISISVSLPLSLSLTRAGGGLRRVDRKLVSKSLLWILFLPLGSPEPWLIYNMVSYMHARFYRPKTKWHPQKKSEKLRIFRYGLKLDIF